MIDGADNFPENAAKSKKISNSRSSHSHRPILGSKAAKISDILMLRIRRTIGDTVQSPAIGLLSEEESSARSPMTYLVSDRFESLRQLGNESNSQGCEPEPWT